MKKVFKFFVLTAIVAAFGVNAMGQVSATNTAGARIIAPIAITSDVNMHFGTIMRGTAPSTILLTPGGLRSVATGDATLSALAPAHAAGSFTVTGEDGLVYTIALPADGTVTLTGPGPAMAVSSFTSNPSGTGTLTGGTSTLTVGATLSVAGPTQTSGAYSGTFDVTVNYQ